MSYQPMKRGEWPRDPAEAEREFRARFPEIVAVADRFRGLGATVKIVAVVNVHGDERGLVDDEMRAAVGRVDETPAVVEPETYRGKTRGKK